jgi:hypothetical protein
MLKTYDVTCPNPDCLEEFEVEMDPETEEEYIDCPECGEGFDWDHDPVADTITLRLDEDDEDDDILMDDDKEDELG